MMGFNDQFQNGIVVLGAGNVATHLSNAIKSAGFEIKCIYSRTINSAKELALKVDSHYTNKIDHIPSEADLYILALKDEVIEHTVKNLNLKHGVVVHTAGSISIDVFKNRFENYGVFYPLQTFSKNREIDFLTVPICIEACIEKLENILYDLAQRLSKNVSFVNSDKRKKLHLAAVFACNFANHMYSVAAEIIKDTDLSLEYLKPLINETAQKAIDSDPRLAQTGPAIRNDQIIIQEHLELLKDYPEFEKIYRFVSDSIYMLNKK